MNKFGRFLIGSTIGALLTLLFFGCVWAIIMIGSEIMRSVGIPEDQMGTWFIFSAVVLVVSIVAGWYAVEEF